MGLRQLTGRVIGTEALGRDKGDLYEAVAPRMQTMKRARKMLTEKSKNLAPIPKIR